MVDGWEKQDIHYKESVFGFGRQVVARSQDRNTRAHKQLVRICTGQTDSLFHYIIFALMISKSLAVDCPSATGDRAAEETISVTAILPSITSFYSPQCDKNYD